MKANELMIGDWVNIYVFPNESPKEKDLFPATITTIMTPLPNEQGGEHIECTFKSEDGGIGCAARPVNTCLPIPLTPEILEKNGWVNVSDEDCAVMQIYRGNDAFWWSSVSGCCGCEGVENKGGEEHIWERFACENIWNVHELQHALRLCGIDKEIVL